MELINVGHVASFHGLKGEIKVKATSDFSNERFKVNNKLILTNDKETLEVTIKSHRNHKGFDLITLEGFDSWTAVGRLKGYSFKVTKDMLFELDEDEYYNFDLIGLEIYDYLNNKIGIVKKVMNLNANDMFVVDHEGKEILIPFVKSIVDQVDIKNKKITLFEIDGLF